MTLVIKHAGKPGHNNVTQMESFGGSRKSSKNKVTSQYSQEQKSSMPELSTNHKGESSSYDDGYLWFGSRGNGGRHQY